MAAIFLLLFVFIILIYLFSLFLCSWDACRRWSFRCRHRWRWRQMSERVLLEEKGSDPNLLNTLICLCNLTPSPQYQHRLWNHGIRMTSSSSTQLHSSQKIPSIYSSCFDHQCLSFSSFCPDCSDNPHINLPHRAIYWSKFSERVKCFSAA